MFPLVEDARPKAGATAVRWRRAQSMSLGPDGSSHFMPEKRIAWLGRKTPNHEILLHGSYTGENLGKLVIYFNGLYKSKRKEWSG